MTFVLVVLRYLFLVFLYLFLFQVIRLIVHDLREVAQTGPGNVGWLRPRACLVVNEGREQGAVFTLGDRVSIGRDAANDIVLPEPTVSAQHAVIIRRGDQFWLQDAGSTNGTYINGRLVVGPVRLQAQDKLTLGETTLQFTG